MSDFGERIRNLAAAVEGRLRVEQEAKRRQEEDELKFLAQFRVASERMIVPTLKELERQSNSAVKFQASGPELVPVLESASN